MGKVYLVGAGCGSLDMYTLKALRCIQNADCLIYDHIIDEQILNQIKRNCELIYVGKQASHHTLKQDEINKLLVEKAQVYSQVVRLKGGDVYVFGRGGEEGQYLYENHIDYEVVPGVTSITGGLAYAGIPITHRGLSSGFQVYTVSLKKNVRRDLPFSFMLDNQCTYVFLMAISHLEYIVNGLIDAGKDLKTPISIVSHASMPSQKVLIGTLDNIIQQFKETPVSTPGIIVVGEVVKMREYLNFYENKSLFSKKILVTTVDKNQYLSDRLRDLGADVTQVMTGRIEYLDTPIPNIEGYLIFASKHGTIGFMKAFLKQYKDIRKLSGVKIICIGNKTNQILNQYGLNADYIPRNANSESLKQEFEKLVEGKKVYLVQGSLISNIDIHNEIINVYNNKETKINREEKHYDYAFFTCASSVERFYQNNQSTIDTFVSIGKQTSKAIRRCYGDVKILETSPSSKEEMIKLLLKEC